MAESKKEIRCYGIDLLKIITMYFVVILHICNYGGVEEAATNIQQYAVCYCYKSITCISVNVFAIISGYIGYDNKKFKLSRLIKLWLMIVFYGVIISIIGCCILPGEIRMNDIIKSFMPITLNQYWYFSAYAGLFFLMPLINKSVEIIEKEKIIKTCIVIIVVFSGYGILGSYFNDPFTLKSGYSLIWLAILYYLGAGIRKYNIGSRLTTKKNIKKVFIIWIFSTLVSVFLKLITMISKCVFFEGLIEYLFMSYISPIVLSLSFLVVILFSKLKLKRFNKQILRICSSSAFGVYIIHTNPFIWENYFKNSFQFIIEYSIGRMMLSIPIIAMVIFICCIVIDVIRVKIFEILKVPLWIEKIENIIKYIFDKMIKMIL